MALPPRLLSRLADLVALPSVSSALAEWNQSNRAVVERLAEELNAAGFTVRLQTVSRAPDKVNLIARRGEGEGGLVLAGHSDTVPCDPDAWHSDPFTLTEREGRLYGLGVADMKGFLALAVEAALEAAAHPLAAPLVLLVTADEESSMAGARALAAADLPPGAAVVIGEPTGNRPVDRHKGVMMERLRLRGRAGHASDPAAGRSALEGMHELIGELLALREAWAARWRDPRFRVPVPTLNLGRIHGGDNPNRICAECELDIDIRLLPGMAIEPLRAELAERLSAVAARRGLEGDLQALVPRQPAVLRAGRLAHRRPGRAAQRRAGRSTPPSPPRPPIWPPSAWTWSCSAPATSASPTSPTSMCRSRTPGPGLRHPARADRRALSGAVSRRATIAPSPRSRP
ncbi:MAG: hypothetical protein KatS3mg121_0787 [Gammaproteobacteria bacterium]|nr:MAG: hypothetical protein KatS3mg121_0787 [Gammaproteobacteria bacterium]